MAIQLRIQRLERNHHGSPDGGRRCRVCGDGTRLGSFARFADYPDWGERGAAQANRCAVCGREPAEMVLVRGIDPDLL